MKNFFKTLIFFIIISAVWYQYGDTLRARVPTFINEAIVRLGIRNVPCAEPISYTLGSFDAQFGISKSYFKSALIEAEMIWEKPFGFELFIYSKEGNLKVNLVYDYRQQATSKLASLGIVVKDNRASYDALKFKFTALKAEYEREKNIFNVRVENFNQKKLAYENEVKSWNVKGGAPEEEYNKLQATQLALENESKDLQATQTHINNIADEINAMVVVLNRLASGLNISVEKYNTVGASRGESFEEGVYSSDGVNEEIDIYEFSSRAKLVRATLSASSMWKTQRL